MRDQNRSTNELTQRSEKTEVLEVRARLLKWYEDHGRRFPWREPTATDYERVMAELLLQRTKAEVVAEFLPGFVTQYPSWISIVEAPSDELEEVLKPLGLWRRRAKSLQALAENMVRRNGRFPSSREDLEQLPGVGQYMASGIMLVCHERPEPLLDVNMARVLERVFGPRSLADIRYDPWLQSISRQVVDSTRSLETNWAVLDFAALVCTRTRPGCQRCCLANVCTQFSTSGDELR